MIDIAIAVAAQIRAEPALLVAAVMLAFARHVPTGAGWQRREMLRAQRLGVVMFV